MQQHPFLENNSGSIFPSQNVSLKEKNSEDWQHACMDAAEFKARQQYLSKLKLYDNYRIGNNEMIKEDYDAKNTENENFDVLNTLVDEMGMPDVVKNYSIIQQPISTLEGEMDNFPDVFNVRGKGDIFEAEKYREQTRLLKEWMMSEIQRNVQEALFSSITSDEEADALFGDEQKYQQAYNEQMSVMYPAQIQKYMKTEYRHVLELWGQFELKDQFERFKLKKLRRKDFYHWLRVAQRFRHLYLSGKGLQVESLNPILTFCEKSPNIDNVQDGKLAGFVELLDVPSIIDKYADEMTDEQINLLQTEWKKWWNNVKRPDGSKVDYLSPNGVPYATPVMSTDPDFYSLFPSMMDGNSVGRGMFVSEEELSKISGTNRWLQNEDMLMVTTAYWKSQRRKGKLHWINPITNLEEIILVDESFEVPKYIKQIKNKKFNYEAGLDTLLWTRETEVWQGIKISGWYSTGFLKQPLYLAIRPADIQVGRLPIAGHFANNINTSPTSFVDNAKSWQWLFNVILNQTILWVQTEVLPFSIFSSDMIPNDKDWGGEDGFTKWLKTSSWGGAGVIDRSPDANGRQDGGQFPREINLDRSTRILARMQMALQIRELAYEQMGVSRQRMGNITSSETATGITQATTASGVQTSSWFTSFFEGEKEILQLQLDAAKYLQSKGLQPDVANKSELSVKALQMAMENEHLYDLHVYVTDSQEELRNLNIARQLAVENNTSEMSMSDRIKLASSTSITEIVEELKESERQMIERNQQQIQLQQQQLEQQGLDSKAAREQAERHFLMEIEKDIQVALIQATGRQKEIDADNNGISDVIETTKVLNDRLNIDNANKIAQDKLALDRQKHNDTVSLANKKEQSEREKRMFEFTLEQEKLKRAKVQGDKSK